MVCEVEFAEWTHDGLLRQPVFLRLRDDKRPSECVRAGDVMPSEAERRARAVMQRGRLGRRSGSLGEKTVCPSSSPT